LAASTDYAQETGGGGIDHLDGKQFAFEGGSRFLTSAGYHPQGEEVGPSIGFAWERGSGDGIGGWGNYATRSSGSDGVQSGLVSAGNHAPQAFDEFTNKGMVQNQYSTGPVSAYEVGGNPHMDRDKS
jgi:hypothetical protein